MTGRGSKFLWIRVGIKSTDRCLGGINFTEASVQKIQDDTGCDAEETAEKANGGKELQPEVGRDQTEVHPT